MPVFFTEDVDFYRHRGEMLLNSKMLKVFFGGIGREMTTIDPGAAMKVQTEIILGEKVYWAGMPNPRVIFHSDDWAAIPFTLIWTGVFVSGKQMHWVYGEGARERVELTYLWRYGEFRFKLLATIWFGDAFW